MVFETILRRLLKKEEKSNAIHKQLNSYLHNRNLKYIGKGDIEKYSYPFQFMNPNFCLSRCDILSGDVFQIQTINNIEYILVASQRERVISAYDTNGIAKKRVGVAGYHYIDDDMGIYLQTFFVCPEYRGNCIGTQILRSLVFAEYDYINKHNIFVHAYATETSEKALSQSQLELLYERFGYNLVSSESEVFLRSDFKSPADSEFLQGLIHEASIRKNPL